MLMHICESCNTSGLNLIFQDTLVSPRKGEAKVFFPTEKVQNKFITSLTSTLFIYQIPHYLDHGFKGRLGTT